LALPLPLTRQLDYEKEGIYARQRQLLDEDGIEDVVGPVFKAGLGARE
jgi:hypothetical protein